MSNEAKNVSVGKPKVGGAIFRAPLGTKLPTDAKTELDAAYQCLGYVSSDGVSNTNSPESGSIKAWGGDTVCTYQSEKTDTFSFKLIECLNVEVLKAVYGSQNVTGDLDAGVTVKANSTEQESAIWVIDLIMRGGVLKRIVIFDASITEMEEIVYTGEDCVGYGVTLTAIPDQNGDTHHEYLVKPTAAAG